MLHDLKTAENEVKSVFFISLLFQHSILPKLNKLVIYERYMVYMVIYLTQSLYTVVLQTSHSLRLILFLAGVKLDCFKKVLSITMTESVLNSNPRPQEVTFF